MDAPDAPFALIRPDSPNPRGQHGGFYRDGSFRGSSIKYRSTGTSNLESGAILGPGQTRADPEVSDKIKNKKSCHIIYHQPFNINPKSGSPRVNATITASDAGSRLRLEII